MSDDTYDKLMTILIFIFGGTIVILFLICVLQTMIPTYANLIFPKYSDYVYDLVENSEDVCNDLDKIKSKFEPSISYNKQMKAFECRQSLHEFVALELRSSKHYIKDYYSQKINPKNRFEFLGISISFGKEDLTSEFNLMVEQNQRWLNIRKLFNKPLMINQNDIKVELTSEMYRDSLVNEGYYFFYADNNLLIGE